MNREDFESLGDKHKKYEALNKQYLMPGLTTVIRLDGRAFHTFTRGLPRPYDERMTSCMQHAAIAVLIETNGCIVYTQSDEITVVIQPQEMMLFGGCVEKIVSVLAATASVAFFKEVQKRIPEKADTISVFDCRIMQYPSYELAVENLLWRETDATRNSLTMACSALYPQSELHGVGRSGQHDLLHAKGINWNDYPTCFKRGSYFAKRRVVKAISSDEWEKIPEKHRPADNMFYRNEVVRLSMPPISKVSNILDVVFGMATPVDSSI